MKTFQITQNFGQSCYGWEYFGMPDNATKEEIEKEAIEFSIRRIENEIFYREHPECVG